MSVTESIEHGLKYNARRSSPIVSGLPLLGLSFQTLGIIYSDIGTSPLYVLNGIWPAAKGAPSQEDIIGGVSAIIWSLILVPLVKYMIISLAFATGEGEGGTFALYQGIYPPQEKDLDADRTLTGDSFHVKRAPTRTLRDRAKWPLRLWCLFGTALTMADGILTPAISVTSAVGGIAVAEPSVSTNIVPISIAFLLVLFFVQQFGTKKLAAAFGPAAFGWFLLLIGTGIYNITYFPGIFRAFDPSRAVLLFVRTKDYTLLSGILLAITGCEAIFANLGQFNALSIRLSFSLFVLPALILAYLGQGARLIHDPDAIISNVFYQSIPGPVGGGLYWIMFIFAIFATIIASQAMITATFSLFQQVINSKSFPPISMIYTSETIQGQIYLPAVNWVLMIGTIVMVAVFTDLARLTYAYGFAVATVMLSTSGLIAIHIPVVKGRPIILGVAYFAFFGFIDALFWGAAVQKVPHGAWVPLVIGVVLTLIMVLWTWAKSLEDSFDGQNRVNLRHFILQNPQDIPSETKEEQDAEDFDAPPPLYYFTPDSSGEAVGKGAVVLNDQHKLQRIQTCAVFHKIAEGRGVPHTFVGFVRQWPALPRVVIFLSVCIVSTARVPAEDRYVVTKVRTLEGFYGVTYYIGFRDDFDVKINDLIENICALERQANPSVSELFLQEIRTVGKKATHIAPHYHVVSKKSMSRWAWIVNPIRRFFVEDVYRKLAQMFPETANWLTSADEIIHVGVNAVI